MAMTTRHGSELPDPDEQDLALLRSAAASLRTHTDQRWVEVSQRILVTALRATRRSRPIRAAALSGPVQVNEQVVVAYLRAAIDGAIPGAAMTGVDVRIGAEDAFEGLTIELVAQYGLELIPLADRARDIAAEVLVRILGLAAPPIIVSTMHVHFSDVTVTDV